MLTQFMLFAEGLAEAVEELSVTVTNATAGGQPSAMEYTLLLTIFLLAVFVGFEIITKVPPTLHTPLMSGSNAISGITLVGALLTIKMDYGWFAQTLGFLAVVLATVNAVGGFMVTHRMLEMFRKKKG
ncbi:NAD(P) transhydrogenase subunit alpha [Polystyrenella longa]|uniref:proton-translocating NAD(P)(+) transhydrogenase n=2 Tax=Polystyrenella longa TaxID=2528007 RepID=A0A518CGK9_9PLAN|nr:NAD(P) transhydrogenase subunit alpha [Polystyrenella longa]QDU78314.1 NAD(P) transhydrogenase subunit alpha [Polystyrenella longa]